MAGTPLPWPLTALPGKRPGEGQGDMINTYAYKKGEEVLWSRVAGLRRFTPRKDDASRRTPRGLLAVGNYLLTAWGGALEAVTPNGTVVPFDLPLPGTQPVTMAANIRQIPQIAVVTDGGAFLASTDTMTLVAYPNPSGSLAGADAVDYYGGYFIFTRPDGHIIASDLQNATIPDLSYDDASKAADGALRPISNGETVLIFGTQTIEVWQDVGKTPFPLQRAATINVGLLSKWAVAGGPNVWERGILFVANDFTVRKLEGYDPQIVSNSAVSEDIQAAAEIAPNDLHAQVYVWGENAIFSLTWGNQWTWELNLSTGAWHRRESFEYGGWRARNARSFFKNWYVQDDKADGLLRVTTDVQTEDGERLIATLESGALKDFPVSVRVPAVNLDFSVGLGQLGRPAPYETDPAVAVSWSFDGGATWANPLQRSLGRQGRFSSLVTLRNLGRSTHQGLRLRWVIVDPVPITFKGGVAPTTSASRARQVSVK